MNCKKNNRNIFIIDRSYKWENSSVNELINRMGGWPIRSGANVSNEWTYEDTFAKFIAKFGSSFTLQTTVTQDFYDAQENILVVRTVFF